MEKKESKKGDKGQKKGNNRIFIVFEGVDCCANFWLNGVYVGFSKDSCLPCEFDITDALGAVKTGMDHVLAIQVIVKFDS